MRASRSRRTGWTGWSTAVLIVMLEMAIPQRIFAQRRAEILPGVRFGPPIRAGVALGVGYGDRWGIAQFAGPMAIAEAGVGGGRVSGGYVFAGPMASGLELLGTVLRTWGSPSQVDPQRTLGGGEVRVSFFLMNLGLGVFRPIDDGPGPNDDRTRYFLNIGLGF
jgi:hypothetical protein